MPAHVIRPFRRSDRDQLTDLVNAHAGAVVPGMGASVAAVLASLDRQPGETITDPWVSERATLVAEQQDRVVAAAHLLRYYADERAGRAYRGLGEIGWLVFWPQAPAANPYWADATDAAGALVTACVRQFDSWGVTSQGAEGDLPVRGVYGVPEQWPHVRALYERAGFAHTGHTEVVYLAQVADLLHRAHLPSGAPPSGAPPSGAPPSGAPPSGGPLAGGLTARLTAARSVGINGTRLSAILDGSVIGYIEVETLQEGERLARNGGWADVGNLRVSEQYRRHGVATWLLGQAAGWLDLARADRLLDYAWLEGRDPAGCDYAGYRAFLAAAGFAELTRTRRGWTRPAAPARPEP